jgi:GTPase SAR1 family protein
MLKIGKEKQKTILFVGEKKTGKTSLVSKYFGDNVKEDMGETIALDYKFGKLMQEDKSQKVSAYEIGGGR